MMKYHMIAGGGGSRLSVVETGNHLAQSILFIHGFSQCSLAWGQQLSSDLSLNHRLVAMDTRGHGSSEKPHEDYDDSKLWADDVTAVIRELNLDRPILCGWSYGSLVILDYIRHYGDETIGGIHLVDAISKLGSDAAMSVLTPELLALVPGLFSREVDESVRSLESLVRLFFARTPSATDLYTVLGYNVSVPPFVRQALFSRVLDNDDVLRTIRKPVLITHGAVDAVVKKEIVDHHRVLVPHAQIDIMRDAGHAPFFDDAARFNKRLAVFCDEVSSTVAAPRGGPALTAR